MGELCSVGTRMAGGRGGMVGDDEDRVGLDVGLEGLVWGVYLTLWWKILRTQDRKRRENDNRLIDR